MSDKKDKKNSKAQNKTKKMKKKKKKQMNKTVVFSGPRKDRHGCISIPYVKSISSQETKQAEKHMNGHM